MSKHGSLKHQVKTNCPGLQPGGSTASKNTVVQHQANTIRFVKWCKARYGCRTYEEITENIEYYLNEYAQWLDDTGKTAATIHTYIAGCCAAWKVPMVEIEKPIRHCYQNTRSRGEKAVDARNDAKRDASPRLYDFAEKVGVRRHEYLALRGNNFKVDESGHFCVEVTKGKGGKYQLQRVLPEDVEMVRSYFDGTNAYVFTKKEMTNKLDLHHIRAEVAQRAYRYYTDRLSREPEYREQLEKEIEARWFRYRGTPRSGAKKADWAWDISRVRGTYRIRGENRKHALNNGLPTVYDRLAVMAVSVFHLSHWRCDVTIDNYLLAV